MARKDYTAEQAIGMLREAEWGAHHHRRHHSAPWGLRDSRGSNHGPRRCTRRITVRNGQRATEAAQCRRQRLRTDYTKENLLRPSRKRRADRPGVRPVWLPMLSRASL
jgi:hypothetical protein